MRSIVAKESDGNIQITFTIPFSEIKKAESETIVEIAKDIEIPGFRKGKAPLDQVREKISQNTLVEHSLTHILPKALAEAIKEHSLKIAIYPKYELLSAKNDEDWQIRAVTCELPEINLGDYKTNIKKMPRDKKQEAVIKYLLGSIKLNIPKILIDEEVNSRLSNLLSRIEKLGLALESYLTSIGKTSESLRIEYEAQAKEAIALDLILSKIVESENISVSEKEIEEAMKVADAKSENKTTINSVIKKRKALEFLINLT